MEECTSPKKVLNLAMAMSSSIFSIIQPTQIVFGEGCSHNLAQYIRQHGNKAFIVTMPELIELSLLEDLFQNLKDEKIDYLIFSEVHPEPKQSELNHAAAIINSSQCDIVVGVGGGSCIDFAKAMAISANHTGDIWDYVNLSNKPPKPLDKPVLPVIALPTTSGTGSEVTPYAVVINENTGQEGTIKEIAIQPKVALVDPLLILKLPPRWTAITGFDAFSHAFESFLNKQNRSPYTDMLAKEAMKILYKYLPEAYQNGKDLGARTAVAYAATLAGLTISLAGTTVGHALVHPTDARLGIPHGLSVSLYLHAVAKKTMPYAIDRFAVIADLFSIEKENNKKDKALAALEQIGLFQKNLGLTNKLSNFTNSPSIVDDIVNDTVTYMFRPLNQHIVKFSRNDLIEIVQESY